MESLTICNREAHFSRRRLLTTAGRAMFFGTVASRLAAAEASDSSQKGRPKSVIVLWLEGGPSQLETFDPHVGGKIGGDSKAIDTSLKGVQFSDTLPQLAEQVHLASVIRSLTSKEGDHERAIYNVKTGYRPDQTLVHPSLGAVLCHESKEGADIPRHISILPTGAVSRGGYLGAAYDPFKVYDPAGRVPDIERRVDQERYDRRVDDLLNVVEAKFGKRRLLQTDQQRTLHAATTRSALTMMTSDQLGAFDVSQESAAVKADFGDTAFGRGCLAATRLIEVGVRCVEVTLTGWDSHINNQSLQASACKTLDAAAASLIKRLQERDLLKTTMVVVGGEFGRTPSINAAGGRDHWPHGFSMMLAGCGIRQGSVYGATAGDEDFKADKSVENVSDAVTVADLHATMLTALGVEYDREVQTPIGRPMLLSEGQPIRAVLAAG